MADEQPNSPSTESSAEGEAQASAPTSEQPTEEASSPSWWQRLLGRRQPREQEPSESDGESAASAESAKLVLTQEELDRRVQAETDRREAKRATDARVRERRELRDKDPWAYAERDRQAEQAQDAEMAQMQFLGAVGVEHDKVSIDPLMEQLPLQERQRILAIEGAGRGLDGRKLVVTEAMKALEKHWKAEGARDAEKKLRGNQAFRKQVLAEARGQTPEPELVNGIGRSSTADQTVSALLRRHYDLPAPREHNELG
jgi:hypothetical protein